MRRIEEGDSLKWSWPGIVVTILAAGVSLSLLLATFLLSQDSLSQPGSNALAAIAGAIVGAISTYLGLHNKREDE